MGAAVALGCALTLSLAPASAQDRPDTGVEPGDYAGIVEAHNAVRRPLGLRPLVWSPIAARQAQGWADQLALENCALRYNPDPARRELYGENVLKAWASTPYKGYLRKPADVVSRWAQESSWYDYAANSCLAPQGRICGSYLQVVWGDTQVVGCGRARCETGEIWVCNYTPRGNVVGARPYGAAAPAFAVAPPPAVTPALPPPVYVPVTPSAPVAVLPAPAIAQPATAEPEPYGSPLPAPAPAPTPAPVAVARPVPAEMPPEPVAAPTSTAPASESAMPKPAGAAYADRRRAVPTEELPLPTVQAYDGPADAADERMAAPIPIDPDSPPPQ